MEEISDRKKVFITVANFFGYGFLVSRELPQIYIYIHLPWNHSTQLLSFANEGFISRYCPVIIERNGGEMGAAYNTNMHATVVSNVRHDS